MSDPRPAYATSRTTPTDRPRTYRAWPLPLALLDGLGQRCRETGESQASFVERAIRESLELDR